MGTAAVQGTVHRDKLEVAVFNHTAAFSVGSHGLFSEGTAEESPTTPVKGGVPPKPGQAEGGVRDEGGGEAGSVAGSHAQGETRRASRPLPPLSSALARSPGLRASLAPLTAPPAPLLPSMGTGWSGRSDGGGQGGR